MQELLNRLQEKTITKEAFADMILNDPGMVELALEGMMRKQANTKFGSAKALLLVSESKPEVLYPYFDYLVPYLFHENKIFRYGMILTLANLVSVDVEKKFEAILPQYFSALEQRELIPASNVTKAAATILCSDPNLQTEIIPRILAVKDREYDTEECRNIILGNVLETIYKTMEIIDKSYYDKIQEFARALLNNGREATRKKAEKLVKKYFS